MSEINVVPYIDVMLVLLIIFMVTAPLLQQGVEVDLPNAPAEPLPTDEEQPEPLVVTVDRQGRYLLNRGEDQRAPVKRTDLGGRVQAVLAGEPGIKVYVNGDEAVNYGRVVEAMVILQNAGVQGVGLITDPLADESDDGS
ncbi:MAG: protein TolR [Gammaproteobacteria bacterium]|nr:protein TolR [Gammaproteobacteria bacterium]